MGMLAGSTIMLLTVIWGCCVFVGKCDIQNSRALNGIDTKGFHLQDSGVSTDIWTSYAARIMAISVVPFLVVQLPNALNSTSGRHYSILISLIVSLLLLIGYCVYQVSQPWIQERRLDYVKHKRVMTGFLKHLETHATGKFYNRDGTINRDVVEKLFKAIDQNGDNHLSSGELRAFVVGMQFEGMGEDYFLDKVMKEFDTDRPDDRIDQQEFVQGISKFLALVRGEKAIDHNDADTQKYLSHYDEQATKEHFLVDDFLDEEKGEEIENRKATTIKAILLILLGTVITVAFADPLVDSVHSFSEATNIPPFFISFVFLPLITNSKGAVSVISFASSKKRKSVSLAFCELYGEVTMGNVVGLTVLLTLVYARGLTWDFSSEVLIVFLVCTLMGALTCFRTTFPLWTALTAILLCPFSLLLVYVLDNFFGWS
ncbi:hypothetical protein SOVF_177950 [Spinacia oleracea]|nr:hypothetical protein SOVF_177950 [Spinacia oleracea]